MTKLNRDQVTAAGQADASKLYLALEKLVPHVLHYASMPHAHSGAHRDAAEARRQLADFAMNMPANERSIEPAEDPLAGLRAVREAGYSVHPANDSSQGWAYCIEGDYSQEFQSEKDAWDAAIVALESSKQVPVERG